MALVIDFLKDLWEGIMIKELGKMRKKFVFSIVLTGIFLLVAVIAVYAGATIDYGQVANFEGIDNPPPKGAVNWTAWNQSWANFLYGGIPNEILTEDSTNCDQGENIGYSNMGAEEDGTTDPYPEWWILMQNFDDPNPSTGLEYRVILGGLGGIYSGTLWKASFNWVNTTSQTNHGTVDIFGTDPSYACPTISIQPVEEPINPEDGRSFTFMGQSDATYYVYRSQNASGADNGASNGRYYYLATETSDSGGYGSYADFEVFNGPAWYLVIEADPDTNAIIGCHSEEADPTGVRVFDFDAVYNPDTQAVDLSWEKSDPTIIGFNIFRSANDNVGNAVQINVSEINAIDEASFTYEDSDIVMGETYYYWIELIDTEGPDDKVGPRTVVPGFSIFLPIVSD